jgi:lycopene cyclase domain-containing protein
MAMALSDPGDPTAQRRAATVVMVMLAMIAVPAALTLNAVHHPVTLVNSNSDPTPHGYTWSLLLFIIPILVIGFWFLTHADLKIPKKAFWRTIAILVPFGFSLDFFFAHRFFVFPNRGATLKIDAPALGRPVPIEEYIFYLTGFVFVLLLYVWLDQFWFAAYNVPDYPEAVRKIPRLVTFHGTSLVVGAILIVLAFGYKKLFSGSPEGFPGYFTFIVVGSLVPSAGFLRTARPFINWRAFSLSMFVMLLVSLLWEATLALPYGWWGFQPQQMMGIFVGGWAGLPIEEVVIWIAVTYTTAIVFEIVKLWQASNRKARHAFLGAPRSMDVHRE